MPSTLVTAPSYYPISLAQAKDHLRVDHTDDDGYIQALIAAATGQPLLVLHLVVLHRLALHVSAAHFLLAQAPAALSAPEVFDPQLPQSACATAAEVRTARTVIKAHLDFDIRTSPLAGETVTA